MAGRTNSSGSSRRGASGYGGSFSVSPKTVNSSLLHRQLVLLLQPQKPLPPLLLLMLLLHLAIVVAGVVSTDQ